MSEQDLASGFSLIPYESRELAAPLTARSHILSEMVESSLALARDSVVTQVDLDSLVREGKRLYRSNGDGMTAENIQAFGLFLRAAEGGHAEAQNRVYRCYRSEQGVQRDEAMELVWLRKSVEGGFAEAQDQLGYCYYFGPHSPPKASAGSLNALVSFRMRVAWT